MIVFFCTAQCLYKRYPVHYNMSIVDSWKTMEAELAFWKRHIYVVQKAISEKEVPSHLNKGWSVKTSVSPACVIVEKPIDIQKILSGIQKVIEDAKRSTLSE